MAINLLNDDDKHSVEDLIAEIDDLEWDTRQCTSSDFLGYFSLPHLVRTRQVWSGPNLSPGSYMFLHSSFDRYSITAKPITDPDGRTLIMSDWCKNEFKIVSEEPRLKKRWWVFQHAFELYRFDLPRRIKVCQEVPVHKKISQDDQIWQKVVLRKNAILTAKQRATYKVILQDDKMTEEKDGFILVDDKGLEYVVPPAVPFRFATEILDAELQSEYKDHSGSFSLPEILMRYKFPLNVTVCSDQNKSDKLDLTLEKFCVSRSLFAVSFGKHCETQLLELSPLSQLSIQCPKCVTGGVKTHDGEVDENENVAEVTNSFSYSKIVKQLAGIITPKVEIYKEETREASQDEIASVDKAFEAGLLLDAKVKAERSSRPAFMITEEALDANRSSDSDEIDLNTDYGNASKSFTVHACIDASNPYNEMIDYECVNVTNECVKNDDVVAISEDEHQSNVVDKKPGTGPAQPSSELRIREAIVMHSEAGDLNLQREKLAAILKDIPALMIVTKRVEQNLIA